METHTELMCVGAWGSEQRSHRLSQRRKRTSEMQGTYLLA
jgi:hypothetical protein